MRSNYANKNTVMRGAEEPSCCLPSKLQERRVVGEWKPPRFSLGKVILFFCYAKINSKYLNFKAVSAKLIMTQQFASERAHIEGAV